MCSDTFQISDGVRFGKRAGASMPVNRRIVQHGTSGDGEVLKDNTAMIREAILSFSLPGVAARECGCTSTTPTSGAAGFAALLTLALMQRQRRR